MMTDADQGLELQELVLRAMARDSRAFEALIAAFNKRLLYYVMRMLHDRDRAEDVVQNVWIDVYRQIARLRSTKAFQAWLYQLTRGHICREISRAGSERQTQSLEDLPEAALAAQEQGLSPEEVAAVHHCMDQLTPEHREVLFLRFMEELSYQEIAGIIGCAVGTVRSRIYYAKQALGSIWRK